MYTTKNWDALVFAGVGSKHEVKPEAVHGTEATVIEVVRRARDSYGEGYEGDSGGYVIFQVGDRFFRRNFSESSFDESELYWWADVEEVFGEVETTIAFRPKER